MADEIAVVGPGNNWYFLDENGGRQPVSEEAFWAELEPKLAAQIEAGGSEAEIQQRLHQAFGQDPRLVALIGRRAPELLQYWPDAQQLVQNFAPADVPAAAPANRIDASDSQGTGPLPAPPHGDSSEEPARQGTAASVQADSKTGGDPAVLFTGQAFYQATDFEVRGRGLHFAWVRTYLNQTIYKGPLGYSWDHSYNLWLREEQQVLPDGSRRNVVFRSTGQLREDPYVQVIGEPVGDLAPLRDFADAVFQSPPGFFERLEKSGGRYTLQQADGVVLEYNDDLQIDRIIDRNGNTMTFEYVDRLLAVVRDPVGKEFRLAYDALNRIATLHDAAGHRTIAYSYSDNGDLIEVDAFFEPDLAAGTDYLYSGPDVPFDLQHNLVEVISPMGQSILDNEYGTAPGTWEFNRLIRQRAADGEYRYEYGPVDDSGADPNVDPVNVPVAYTRVVAPNGHAVEHWFNRQGNVVRRKEQVSDGGIARELSSTYRYNLDALLVSETLPDGSGTDYRYAREAFAELHGGDASGAGPAERLSFGNLLRVCKRPRAGSGEDRSIVSEFSYVPGSNRLAMQKGPFYADALLNMLPGQTPSEFHYEYDGPGNLIRITHADLEQADGSGQPFAATEQRFDAHGMPIEIVQGGRRTEWRYFGDDLRSGFIERQIEGGALAVTTLYDVDALGRITRTVDPLGAITQTEWTRFDAPLQVRMPEVVAGGQPPATSYRYDRNRNVVEILEELQLDDGGAHPDRAFVERFRYDEYGRVIEQSSGGAGETRAVRIVLNPSGLVEREIGPSGDITATRYDERMRPIAIIRGLYGPDECITRMQYDDAGGLTASTDAGGHTTTLHRDGFARAQRIRDPDGSETVYDFDAAGRPVRWRLYGEDGVRWGEEEFRYDAIGRLIEQIEHLFLPGVDGADESVRTRYFYNAADRVERVVFPGGAVVRYAYDALGRMVSLSDADANVITWAYDDAARTATITQTDAGTDRAGTAFTQTFRQVRQFDHRGLMVARVAPGGGLTRARYDSRGLPAVFVDAGGHESTTEYNAFGEPVVHRTRVNGEEIRQTVSYVNGNVREVISPRGGIARFSYDSLNRLIGIERNGSRSEYVYDRDDRIVSSTDEDGVVIATTYTAGGLLATAAADASGFAVVPQAPEYRPDPAETRTFRYTPAGDIVEARNDTSTVRFEYDSLGRVVGEETGGRMIRYRYDSAGRQTRIQWPGGRDIEYAYSPAGRLLAVQQISAGAGYPGDPEAAKGRSLARIWRIGNRPAFVDFASGYRASFHYDAGFRLSGADWTGAADGTSVFRERTLYGPSNEAIVQQRDGLVRMCLYDDLTRLIEARDFALAEALDVSDLGPPASAENLDAAPSQQDVDQLIVATEAAVAGMQAQRSFAYGLDTNTNRRSTEQALTPQDPPVTTLYDADEQDRYTSIGGVEVVHDRAGDVIAAGEASYRYDAFGQVSAITTGEETVAIARDALGRVCRMEGADGVRELCYSGANLIQWESNGAIAGQAVPLASSQRYIHVASAGTDAGPVFDAIGTVLAWVGPEGAVVSRPEYDPFGRVLTSTADWPAPFGFGGFLHEPISGTYLLPARTYHPRWGRYLQPDPLGPLEDPNVYAYARHAPTSLFDESGFSAREPDWESGTWEQAGGYFGGLSEGVGKSLFAMTGVGFLYGQISHLYGTGEALIRGRTPPNPVLDAIHGIQGEFNQAVHGDTPRERAEATGRLTGELWVFLVGMVTGPKTFAGLRTPRVPGAPVVLAEGPALRALPPGPPLPPRPPGLPPGPPSPPELGVGQGWIRFTLSRAMADGLNRTFRQLAGGESLPPPGLQGTVKKTGLSAWGSVFRNEPLKGRTTPELPVRELRYYREYTTYVAGQTKRTAVPGRPGLPPWVLRTVTGAFGEVYFSWTHYGTSVVPGLMRVPFVRVR